MSHSELIQLVRDLKGWYLQEIPNASVSPAPTPILPTKKERTVSPPPPPIQVHHEPPPPVIEESEIAKWAKRHFSVVTPIPPILCFGDHPMLQKLAVALSEHLAPAECVTTLPDLNHPLLKLLLVPLPYIQQHGELRHKFPRAALHVWEKPVLPLYPIDHYLQDGRAKRDLWNVINQLPLFS